MNRIFTTLLVIVASVISLPMQAQQVEWNQPINETAIIDWEVIGNHIYVTGENSLTKLDTDGNVIFKIEPNFEGKITQHQITSNGIYLAYTGGVNKYSLDGQAILDLKLDKPYGCLDFVVDAQENLYICNEDFSSIYLSKISSEYETVFSKKLFAKQDPNSAVSKMIIGSDNNIYLSGYHAGADLTDEKVSLTGLKTGKKAFIKCCNTDGESQWVYSTDFQSDANALSFAAFNDLYFNNGNLIATGKFTCGTSNKVLIKGESYPTVGEEDGIIASFEIGQLTWVNILQGEGLHDVAQLDFDADNNIIMINSLVDAVTYGSEEINQEGRNHVIMKINADNGNMVWNNTFSQGPEFYNVPKFTITDDKNIYITGVTNSFYSAPFASSKVIEEPYMGFIAKMDKDGNLDGGSAIKNGKSYYEGVSNVSNDLIFLTCLFNDVDMYGTNISVSNTGSMNYVVGRLSGSGSVRFDENDDFQIAIYPNPATDHVRIDVVSEDNEEYELTVFDLQGKIMMTQSINVDQNKLDISELNSGMYMIQLKGNNKSVSKRLVKMK